MVIPVQQGRQQKSEQQHEQRSTPHNHAPRQNALLQGVAEAARQLLAIADFDTAIYEALGAIAHAADLDRLYILEYKSDSSTHADADCLYEWTAKPAAKPAAEPKNNANDTQALSHLSLPIELEGLSWGHIGFESYTTERLWSDAETEVLKTAAACVGSAIYRDRTSQTKTATALASATELAAYNQQLRNRDSLLKCVNNAAQCLVAHDDLSIALPAALKILGEGTQQCRAYILRNSYNDHTQETIFNLHLEWDAPHIPSKIEAGGRFPVPVSNFPKHLSAPLKVGQATQFFASELDGIGPDERPKGQARSLLSVPITIRGQWWGILGLDDCLYERVWSEAEIAVLETAATAVGSAIERDQSHQAREVAEREILIAQERAARAAALEAANQVLMTRDRWLAITAAAANQLLSSDNVETNVKAALQTIGENLECDRVVVLQYVTEQEAPTHKLGLMRLLYEWNAEGIRPQGDYAGFYDIPSDGIEDWFQQLIDGNWVGGLTKDAAEPFRSVQRALDVETGYAMPVLVEGMLWGAVCIDYCREVQPLESAEIAVFRTAATCVGSAIYQANVRRDRAAQERARLLGSVAEAANLLLRSADYTSVFPEVVRLLGEAVECDRCSITQDVMHPRFHKLAIKLREDWCASNQMPVADPAPSPFDEDGCILLTGDFLVFHQALCRGEVVNFLVADLASPEKEMMEGQGNTSMLIVPIMVQGQCWGEIGFDNCGDPRPYEKSEIAILQVAAESIAAAISRQAQDKALRQAEKAVLEEQERAARDRARELTRINESISKTLSALAASPELDQFLGSTLAEVAQQIGAYSVHLFLFDPAENTLTLSLVVEGGQIYLGTGPNDCEFFKQPIPADHTPAWTSALKSKQTLNYDENTPYDDTVWWPEAIVWHKSQGHKAATCIPMLAGEQPVGFLGIAFLDRTLLSPEQIEFMRALVNQVIIAIQLTRLAEQTQTAALSAALNNERTRLAREIHDTLAQSFTGVSLQLEAVRGLTAKLTHSSSHLSSLDIGKLQQAQTYILRARDLARKGLSEARRSVSALRSEALETDTLTEALRKVLDQTTRDTGLKTQFHLLGEPCALADDLQLNLLRIAQEAVTNVLRHAQATELSLTLAMSPSEICLQAIDDGVGFEVSSLDQASGFGLVGIRERSARFGGQLHIISSPHQGTTLKVVLPCCEYSFKAVPTV
ncbi:MAG: GAF domain-containing protein [Cyanobacteria bacterium J06560_2]